MAQSLSQVLLHVVFATKERRAYLQSPDLRHQLEGYIVGILKKLDCPSLALKAMPDHVHCLCQLARTVTVAQLLEEVKRSSSKWLKLTDPRIATFSWQAGYGVFSVSASQAPKVKRYIQTQEAHHADLDYRGELLALLKKHGVPYDEQFLWT